MHHNFKAVLSRLIEVYPYKRDQKPQYGPGRQANKYGVEFIERRRSSGLDLLWHHPKYFNRLSKDQKDKLFDWIHSDDGKKLMKASRKATQTNKKMGSGSGIEGENKPEGECNWKKK